MVRAVTVNPDDWSNINIIFENEYYAVISGNYQGDHALGERWSGEGNELGYPNSRGKPLWYVIPRFLAIWLLHGLLHELNVNPCEDKNHYTKYIIEELDFFTAN